METINIQPKFVTGDIVLHLKTRGEYTIVADPHRLRIEATNTAAYAYQSNAHDSSQTLWVRPQKEMEDGRFVLVEKG